MRTWYLFPSPLTVQPNPLLGLGAVRSGLPGRPGWAGVRPSQVVYSDSREHWLPFSRRGCCSNPTLIGQLPCQDAVASGHMAPGPHHQYVPKPLAPHPTPPSPVTPSGQLLQQWVQPRQTLLDSSPCSGHQPYLPKRGKAPVPPPSSSCSPRPLRGRPWLGQPPPGPELPPGDRPEIAAL